MQGPPPRLGGGITTMPLCAECGGGNAKDPRVHGNYGGISLRDVGTPGRSLPRQVLSRSDYTPNT